MTLCIAVVSIALAARLRAQAPSWTWGARGGGDGADRGGFIAADGSGGVYVLGTFTGTATFGGKSVTSHGGADIFLARYSASGECEWVKGIGGAERDEPGGIAVDAAGDAYITGAFQGTLMVPHESGFEFPMSSAGDRDFFLLQFRGNGDFGWSTTGGGAGADVARGVARDNAGNIYLVGTFSGTMTIDERALTSDGERDVFVAKLAPLGALLWMQRGGGASGDEAYGVAVDGAGRCYISGEVKGSMTFSERSVTTGTGEGFFLACYNTDGSVAWAKGDGDRGLTSRAAIAVDPTGRIVLTGSFREPLRIGAETMESQGEDDMFVAGYDAGGGFRWARQLGGSMIQTPSDIVVDAAGSAYITGFSQNLEDGSIFVARYLSDGTPAWLRSDTYEGAGSGGGAYSGGISLDAQGNIYISGEFSRQIAFGATVLTAAGNGYDVFIAKLGGTSGVNDGLTSKATLLGSAPNPCSEGTVLRFNLDAPADLRVTLVDMQGRIVRATRHQLFTRGEHTLRVSTGDLPQGSYLLQLHTGDAVLTQKLDVMR